MVKWIVEAKMHEESDVTLTPDQARQSVMTGHMRYVLGISLTLAIVAMVVSVVAG